MKFFIDNTNATEKQVQLFINSSVLFAALIGLYFTTWVNYLLFHALAEIFSIVVAFSLFMIAWNSKKYISNTYLLFVGIAYLFIALLDLLHTLSYKGMPIFTDYDYYANQLWIGARYLESITLLIAFIFLRGERIPRANVVFAVYSVITGLIIASIFYWKIFPVCFVEGSGLTSFKKNSEYIICGILAAALFLLRINRTYFDKNIFLIIFWSIICTIISELSFTFYISNYGFSNLVGHYFKIFSFLLIYVAIIKTGIEKPLELIFFDLDGLNKNLEKEVRERIKIQQKNEELINSLTRAFEEIKTLEGILPVCMYCKKIRDDTGTEPGKGKWLQMEEFLYRKSGTAISHGCCQDCFETHKDD